LTGRELAAVYPFCDKSNHSWTDQIPGDPLFGTDLGKYTASGALGGVQAGCNYQVGTWVFGVQGDCDWSNANGSNSPGAFVPFAAFSDQSQIKSLASVTARVGYAWTDRFLGDMKAGGAWEKSNYSILFGGAVVAASSETREGWTIGVGGEYAFFDWLTGFIEYDYYGFGTNTNSFVCGVGCGIPAAAVLGVAA
jgi:outer membrane immunogenic protein